MNKYTYIIRLKIKDKYGYYGKGNVFSSTFNKKLCWKRDDTAIKHLDDLKENMFWNWKDKDNGYIVETILNGKEIL